MLPFLNSTPPPNRIDVATKFAQSCLGPIGKDIAKGGLYKLYKHFKGDSLEKKEEAELRRLTIEALNQSDGTRMRQAELSRISAKQRKRESKWWKIESELCKLKLQRLQSPNEEEIELRRCKLKLLQDAQNQKSRLRHLKIQQLRHFHREGKAQEAQLRAIKIEKLKSAPDPKEVMLRNLQIKLIERQLREYDDAAEARTRTEKAVERYRESKLRFLERELRYKRKRAEGTWERDEQHASPTVKRRKKLPRSFQRPPGMAGAWDGGAEPSNTALVGHEHKVPTTVAVGPGSPATPLMDTCLSGTTLAAGSGLTGQMPQDHRATSAFEGAGSSARRV